MENEFYLTVCVWGKGAPHGPMIKCSGSVEDLNSLHHLAQMGVQAAKQQIGFTEFTQSYYE